MKKIIIIVLVLLLIGLVFIFVDKGAPTNLLGDDVKVYLYTVDNQSTGQLSVSVPFTKQSSDNYVISLAIDLDNNGEISDGEWQVKQTSAYLVQNLRNNFWLADPDKKLKLGDEVLIRVAFKLAASDKEAAVDKKVVVEGFDIGTVFGFDVPGASEEFKRGIGLPQAIVPVAYAEGGDKEIFREANTPDLAQGPMECAAVSAANGLMSLAGENNQLGKLPKFTGELIEELKTDMKYTTRGISLANMVAGKNAFAARRGLPVVTELKFAPTKEDILKAIQSGAAVELSFSFVQSRSGRANTGHVVTLVGASNNQIFVHDSATPEGMDSLNMHGIVQTSKNKFINVLYPLWDGTAFVDGIVIQNWTEPKHAEESYIDGGEQGSEIEVLVINGHYFPKSFFRVGDHGECKQSHYHLVSGSMAFGLKDKTSSEIVSMADPNPNSCGFGKVSEVPVEKITITFAQSEALIKHLPN